MLDLKHSDLFVIAVPVTNGVSHDGEQNDDEDSPLLRNSINGEPNYMTTDDSVSPQSDRVIQVASRSTPNCINPGIV